MLESVSSVAWSDRVLDAAEDCSRRIPLIAPTHRGLAVNTTCGDRVEVELVVGSAGQIEQIAVMPRGCTLSRAAAAMLATAAEGRGFDEIAAMPAAEMLDLIGGGHQFGIRRRCVLLPLQALRCAMPIEPPGRAA